MKVTSTASSVSGRTSSTVRVWNRARLRGAVSRGVVACGMGAGAEVKSDMSVHLEVVEGFEAGAALEQGFA